MRRQITALCLLLIGASRTLAAEPAPTTAEPAKPSAKIGGYVQARETYRHGPGLSASINRARVTLDGTVRPNFDYRVAVEFASASGTSATPSLRDAYLKWSHDWLSATGGQFKTPFSREFITSLSALEVANRSTVVDSLATKRDIGAMAEGNSTYGTLSLGVFNGEGQNALANRDSTEMYVARAVVRPIAPVSIASHIATRGSQRRTMGAEANAEYRGALLRGEYIADRVDGRDRDDYGWYVLAGYRVKPWLQLIARQDDFQRPTLGVARRITTTTGGINFDFAGGQTRVLLDYEGQITGAARTHSDFWIAQLQVKW